MMNLCVEVKKIGDIVPFDWNFGMCSLALQIFRLLTRLENEEGLVRREVRPLALFLSCNVTLLGGRYPPPRA